MITKEEVVQMLSENSHIEDYTVLSTQLANGEIPPLATNDMLLILFRCIDAQNKVIQTILERLNRPITLALWTDNKKLSL